MEPEINKLDAYLQVAVEDTFPIINYHPHPLRIFEGSSPKKRVGERKCKETLYPQTGTKRNHPCPCGSNIKFKNCCWDKPKEEK